MGGSDGDWLGNGGAAERLTRRWFSGSVMVAHCGSAATIRGRRQRVMAVLDRRLQRRWRVPVAEPAGFACDEGGGSHGDDDGDGPEMGLCCAATSNDLRRWRDDPPAEKIKMAWIVGWIRFRVWYGFGFVFISGCFWF